MLISPSQDRNFHLAEGITVQAMLLRHIVSLSDVDTPLELVNFAEPQAQLGEVLIRVSACGVCHTDLDEIEGRTIPPRLPVIPGHQVVGRVAKLGTGVTSHRIGDRVGIGWIHHSSGDDDEKLSPQFCATGRDVNGGYAQRMTVPSRYAYPIS